MQHPQTTASLLPQIPATQVRNQGAEFLRRKLHPFNDIVRTGYGDPVQTTGDSADYTAEQRVCLKQLPRRFPKLRLPQVTRDFRYEYDHHRLGWTIVREHVFFKCCQLQRKQARMTFRCWLND